MSTDIQFGTCSWKYPDWRGLVYGDATPPGDFLREYAQRYETVEIDQWFWSLFAHGKLVLPQPGTVAVYAAAVPAGFLFGVKLPNALTLPHLPGSGQALPPEPNPHFLSPVLLRDILSRLEPLHGKLGPVMLQFGYLNQQAMPSQAAFHERLAAFAGRLPDDYEWAVEIRNPNYLNPAYFDLLRQLRLAPVLQQGYYLPPVAEVYARHADLLADSLVIRLHGADRQGIEKRTGRHWGRLADPHDAELDALAGVLLDIRARKRKARVYANNHFEGCAPLTLQRLQARLEGRSDTSAPLRKPPRGQRPAAPRPVQGTFDDLPPTTHDS